MPARGQSYRAWKNSLRRLSSAERAKLRTLVLQRDHHRCRCCGRMESDGVELTLDHIIPASLGGPPKFHNLQTLCAECNAEKGDQMVRY